ncbi:recombinase family protein [Streptomyces wuyuanensis]|uniref:recombinase family protein n=1 Tax=Streptomyces wuyuanensis TaxID=1196353 RepID=UPI003438AA51
MGDGSGHRRRRTEATTKPTRVGYARWSTAQQELQSQLDAFQEAGCDPVFSEKISTRVKVRPEYVKAMDFARTIKRPGRQCSATAPEYRARMARSTVSWFSPTGAT